MAIRFLGTREGARPPRPGGDPARSSRRVGAATLALGAVDNGGVPRRWWVVIPVKPPHRGKTRIAGRSPGAVRWIAEQTIAAAAATPSVAGVVVVTPTPRGPARAVECGSRASGRRAASRPPSRSGRAAFPRSTRRRAARRRAGRPARRPCRGARPRGAASAGVRRRRRRSRVDARHRAGRSAATGRLRRSVGGAPSAGCLVDLPAPAGLRRDVDTAEQLRAARGR